VNPLTRIADRIHAKGDAEARAQGLEVVALPFGRRLVRHPGLPAMLEARRRKAYKQGLDLADQHVLGLRRPVRQPRRTNRDSDYITA